MDEPRPPLVWWRQLLVDAGLTYLGWVLPPNQHFQIEYQPTDKTWSIQVLEADTAREQKEE